ncbi:MAG: hypothetical protein IPL18_14795 [Sphingomonadales bacterium]|nr:hypothetical protein [Sphingomonadales bacterium]
MEFEPLGRTGELNEALKLVQHELPLDLSSEEQSRLAVEVYKAWLNAEALGRIASSISGLTTTLEASGLSRNHE